MKEAIIAGITVTYEKGKWTAPDEELENMLNIRSKLVYDNLGAEDGFPVEAVYLKVLKFFNGKTVKDDDPRPYGIVGARY